MITVRVYRVLQRLHSQQNKDRKIMKKPKKNAAQVQPPAQQVKQPAAQAAPAQVVTTTTTRTTPPTPAQPAPAAPATSQAAPAVPKATRKKVSHFRVPAAVNPAPAQVPQPVTPPPQPVPPVPPKNAGRKWEGAKLWPWLLGILALLTIVAIIWMICKNGNDSSKAAFAAMESKLNATTAAVTGAIKDLSKATPVKSPGPAPAMEPPCSDCDEAADEIPAGKNSSVKKSTAPKETTPLVGRRRAKEPCNDATPACAGVKAPVPEWPEGEDPSLVTNILQDSCVYDQTVACAEVSTTLAPGVNQVFRYPIGWTVHVVTDVTKVNSAFNVGTDRNPKWVLTKEFQGGKSVQSLWLKNIDQLTLPITFKLTRNMPQATK